MNKSEAPKHSAVQKPRRERTMHAHRAFGAEFLTAEAADADLFVDHGALIHDPDRVRRADVAAFAAANALFPINTCITALPYLNRILRTFLRTGPAGCTAFLIRLCIFF